MQFFWTPVDWEAITPALEELKEADVKIINVDTQVKEFDYVDAYIGSDNKNAGYLCGKDLVEKLPEGGKVLILECPTMNSINERITGFEEAIADKGFEVVGRSDTKGDLNTALSAAETLLKEHPDVSAIMCGKRSDSAWRTCRSECGSITERLYLWRGWFTGD